MEARKESGYFFNPKMNSFEKEFEASIESKDLAGAVLTASDITGRFQYSKAFGPQSLDDVNSKPMDPNQVFWIASCTKLITTVAAMQAVERGLFTLDEDVSKFLPEFKDIEIIVGFEKGSDKPILEKNTEKITLRQLLTHSSGIGYDHFSPTLQRYRAWQGISPAMKGRGKVYENYFYPLSFVPGTRWEYSAGIDWAGVMTQRANGNSTLEEYMKKNVWGPLGMTDSTFHLESRPDLRARLTEMAEREGGADPVYGIPANPDGKIIKTQDRVWPDPVEDDSGGAGVYSTPKDYQKLLNSLAANDGKLLKKETVDEMFKPQLSEASKASLNQLLTIPQMCLATGSPLPPGSQLDWGLGGMLCLETAKYKTGAGRSSGSMFWSGYPNLFWFIDRNAGISGSYFSQLIPPGDHKSADIFRKFESAIYECRPSL